MFFDDNDPRPAAEQINEKYAHGGGWNPIPRFTMEADGTLRYPGVPPLPVLAEAIFRNELIRFYDHAWVAIMQPGGAFEVSRMD
jgi:hypothetical protein